MKELKGQKFTHLFLGWKVLSSFLIILSCWNYALLAQEKPYSLYKDKIVVYSDLGFNTAPFSLKSDFPGTIKYLKFRNNFRAFMGLGVNYKWFGLRLGGSLIGNVRSVAKYGQTNYFDIGFDFTIKKTFTELDFRIYNGYSIKDAKRWNDTLDDANPNLILPSLRSTDLSLSIWYIHNKDIHMSAIKGKTGLYHQKAESWYLRSMMDVYGVGTGGGAIIPSELQDSLNTKIRAHNIAAFEIGSIPGWIHVNNKSNWQYGLIGGLGPVLQAKSYSFDDVTRSFLGLAIRYDIRLMAGYNVPHYFVLMHADFYNKSIRFSNLKFHQNYYTIRFIGGYRFTSRKEKRKVSNVI